MAGDDDVRARRALVPWLVRGQRRFDLAVTDKIEQDETAKGGPDHGFGQGGPSYDGSQVNRFPVGEYDLQPTQSIVPEVLVDPEHVETTPKAAWSARLTGFDHRENRSAAPIPLSLPEITGPAEEAEPEGDDRLRLEQDARPSENAFEDVDLILD